MHLPGIDTRPYLIHSVGDLSRVQFSSCLIISASRRPKRQTSRFTECRDSQIATRELTRKSAKIVEYKEVANMFIYS